MKLKQTANIMLEANKDAAGNTAKLVAGRIINARLSKIVKPKLPMYARGYAGTPIGEAVIANVVASALIHFMPSNQKVVLAADSMIQAAMLEFAGSFDIEGMVDELLDGVKLPEFTKTEEA